MIIMHACDDICVDFQALLVMCPQDTRKNFKPSKSSPSSSSAGAHCTPSTQQFLAQVLSPLLETHSTAAGRPLHETLPQGVAQTKALLLSSEAISYHIDELRLSLVHTAAVQRSAEHIARYDHLKSCPLIHSQFHNFWPLIKIYFKLSSFKLLNLTYYTIITSKMAEYALIILGT